MHETVIRPPPTNYPAVGTLPNQASLKHVATMDSGWQPIHTEQRVFVHTQDNPSQNRDKGVVL